MDGYNEVEEFSGVSLSAGPSGDLARLRNRLYLSMGLCAMGLCAGVWIAWVVTTTNGSEDAFSSNLVAVVGSLMIVWVLASSALLLALGAGRGGDREERLRSLALWSSIALLLAAFALTIFAASYVILAIIIGVVIWKKLTA